MGRSSTRRKSKVKHVVHHLHLLWPYIAGFQQSPWYTLPRNLQFLNRPATIGNVFTAPTTDYLTSFSSTYGGPVGGSFVHETAPPLTTTVTAATTYPPTTTTVDYPPATTIYDAASSTGLATTTVNPGTYQGSEQIVTADDRFVYPSGESLAYNPDDLTTGAAYTGYGAYGGLVDGGYTSNMAYPSYQPMFADRFSQFPISSRMPYYGDFYMPPNLEHGHIRTNEFENFLPQRIELGGSDYTTMNYYGGYADSYQPVHLQHSVINPESYGAGITDQYETQADQRFTSEPVITHMAHPAHRVSSRVHSVHIDSPLPVVESLDDSSLIATATQLSTALDGLAHTEPAMSLGERMQRARLRQHMAQMDAIRRSRQMSGTYGLQGLFGSRHNSMQF